MFTRGNSETIVPPQGGNGSNGAVSRAAPAVAATDKPERQVAVVIELSSPLPHFNSEIWKIELRKPEFGDWLEAGDIHRTTIFDPQGMQAGSSGAVRVEVNAEALGKWFARLSGLPMASLTKLSMKDARTVMREVVALVGSIDATD